jgi:hypothetical protein
MCSFQEKSQNAANGNFDCRTTYVHTYALYFNKNAALFGCMQLEKLF